MTNLTPQELAAGRNVMKQCMAVKPGESVLIVTDPTRRLLVGLFESTAREVTDKVEVINFTGMTENAQEPPKEVAQKMATADVALLVTTYSLSHTKARKNAGKAGVRIASLPGITKDMIVRTLTADYSQVAKLSDKIAKILTEAKTAQLTSPGGTNLSFSLAGRVGMADGGLYTKPGDFGNLPAGEACIGPLEGKTQGILVIDGALAEIELDRPVEVIIKDGFAVSISGGRAAKTLAKLADAAGPNARAVGELGIGTNPFAQLSSNVLEAEKVFGTCHVALGSNISYGGIINVPFHSDGIVSKPTVTIDGRVVVKDNKVVI